VEGERGAFPRGGESNALMFLILDHGRLFRYWFLDHARDGGGFDIEFARQVVGTCKRAAFSQFINALQVILNRLGGCFLVHVPIKKLSLTKYILG
jgi:hypothetical protein